MSDILGRAVGHLFPKTLTAEEQAAVEAILGGVEAWRHQGRDWVEVARLGAITPPGGTRPSPQYGRFVAMGAASQDDPRRATLTMFCDFLMRQSGAVLTTQGVFDPDELYRADAIVKGSPS